MKSMSLNEWVRIGESGFISNILFLEGFENSANIYVVEGDGEISLIDTGNDYTAFPELFDIHKVDEISAVFLTHSHNDHSLGLIDLLQNYTDFDNLDLYVHEVFHERLKKVIEHYGRDIRIRTLKGGENIRLSGERFEVLKTPGHTIDSLSLYHPESLTLFSGDAVSAKPVIDNTLGGRLTDFIISLRHLRKKKVELILPGHTLPGLNRDNEILNRAYLKAIGFLSPNYSLVESAREAIKAGMIEEALFALEKQIELEPEDEEAKKMYASLLADLGESEKAVKLIKELPESADTLYLLGMIAMNDGELETAEKYLKKSLEMRDDRLTRLALVSVLVEMGKIEEAREFPEFKLVEKINER